MYIVTCASWIRWTEEDGALNRWSMLASSAIYRPRGAGLADREHRAGMMVQARQVSRRGWAPAGKPRCRKAR